MNTTRDNDLPVIPVLVLTALIFSLSLIPRFFDIVMWLPQYWIDENDIVEPGIAFLGGDINPRVHGYGPLYAYILTLVNFTWMKLQGLDYLQYAGDIFFEPTRFYLIARIINSLLNIILAIAGLYIARIFFGKQAAIIALPLLAFPFADILASFSVRIDTLLAVLANLSILAAWQITNSEKTKWYVISGFLFGLSVATKPLPGLLVLPLIILAHFFHLHNQGNLTGSQRWKSLSGKLYFGLKTAIFNAKICYLFLAALVTNFIFNPYSAIDMSYYLDVQKKIYQIEGSRGFTYGFDITRFFDNLGYAFVIVAAVAVAYIAVQGIRHHSQKVAILLTYPVTYYLAFAAGSARDYWYVTLIPVLCTCIAKLVVDFSGSYGMRFRNTLLLLLPALIIAQPFLTLAHETHFRNEFTPYRNFHTALAGKSWIEQNIRPKASILLYGWPTDLPRIVDLRPGEQATIGQYFMYKRDKNMPYRDLYEVVHRDYVSKGNPVYFLSHVGSFCDTEDNVTSLNNRISSGEYDYLITHCDIQEVVVPPPELVKTFAPPEYPYGVPFWIFKLK